MISFMASAVGTVFAAFVATCPSEFLVNCSGYTGKQEINLTYYYETKDGQKHSGSIGVGPGQKPWLIVVMLSEGVERGGWHVQKMCDLDDTPNAFLLYGPIRSPVKVVTITGDTWAPTIEHRFLPKVKAPFR